MVSRLGLGQRAPVLKHNAEIERRARVTAFIRAPERRLSFGQRPMLCEQHAEIYSGSIVAAIRRAAVCGRGLIESASLPEQQHGEPKRAVGIAALVGPAVRRLGLGQHPTVLEQNAEIERRDRVAALIRAPECRLGLGQCPMLCEQHAELQSRGIVAATDARPYAAAASSNAPCSLRSTPSPKVTIAIATLIGPAICRLGLGQRPLLFEQSTEVRGGRAMATLIRATIGSLRLNHAPLALEQ